MLAGNPPHTGATAQQIIMKIIDVPRPVPEPSARGGSRWRTAELRSAGEHGAVANVAAWDPRAWRWRGGLAALSLWRWPPALEKSRCQIADR
jgi:hypothetical protein